MTSTCGSAPPRGQNSPETTHSRCLTTERGTGGAGSRAPSRASFARCLEHALREGRAGRAGVAPSLSSGSAAPRGTATSSDRAPEDARGADPAFAEMTRDSVALRLPHENERDPRDAVGIGDVAGEPAIDPTMQILLATPPRSVAPTAVVADARAPDVRTPMEQLMSKLVRRVAWSGNARSGAARLELGAGELEGATLLIQADHGAVRVTIDLPPGVDRAAWRDRIAGKLGNRGLHVEDIEVT